jgi:hypothetical protein
MSLKIYSSCNAAELSAAATLIGILDGSSHIWVDIRWLVANGHPQASEWMSNFRKMLDFARSRGWLDEGGQFVRVHIENAAPNSISETK